VNKYLVLFLIGSGCFPIGYIVLVVLCGLLPKFKQEIVNGAYAFAVISVYGWAGSIGLAAAKGVFDEFLLFSLALLGGCIVWAMWFMFLGLLMISLMIRTKSKKVARIIDILLAPAKLEPNF
jgi:hypothetical protein